MPYAEEAHRDAFEQELARRGMTSSVVACTLWVVGWELVTVIQGPTGGLVAYLKRPRA